MAHDPSSPPKFLVPETGHQKLVSTFFTPDTRNWHQKHGVFNFVGYSVHFDSQNAAGPSLLINTIDNAIIINEYISNANSFADDGLRIRRIMRMQISAANGSVAFESRASKFLVTNRTLSYCGQVSGIGVASYGALGHVPPLDFQHSYFVREQIREMYKNNAILRNFYQLLAHF